tara:strand:+ start:433 stop:627 length:195 start_codon:yes stop_codon:yes gene_type:complete
MVLSAIENSVFREINTKLNNLINDSSLEQLSEFYEEDCEFRLSVIDEAIELLIKERKWVNNLPV